MKSEFRNAADVAQALKETDMVDDVVRQLAGNDKRLLGRLKDVVDLHFIADAHVWPEERIIAFAEELFETAQMAPA